MSGFLHRLAAQTMGSTSTVRSAARQPYAAPLFNAAVPEGQSSAYDAESPRRQMSNDDARPSGTSAGHEARNPTAHVTSDVQLFESVDAPSSSESFAAHATSERASDAEHHVAPSAPLQAIGRQSDARTEGLADEFLFSTEVAGVLVPSRGSAADSRTADRRDPAFPDSAPLLPPGDVALPAPSSAAFPADAADGAAPRPLLPLNNSAEARAQNIGATVRSRETGHSVKPPLAETTEVHVTIGRIEVTAIHEAPPPKRQAPAAAKPMSLDEYLAHRRREA